MKRSPVCPSCGQPAATKMTRFGPRHECCGLRSWNGRPLVSDKTHTARQAAHAAFDPLWQSGALSRDEAYRRLAAELGLNAVTCHMTVMDAKTANLVPAAVERIREALP